MTSSIEHPTKEAQQLGETYQLGAFVKGYQEPGHLLFFGTAIVAGVCGLIFLFGPNAIFGVLWGVFCLAFALLALLAGLGGLYLGRRQVYLYAEGFVLTYVQGLSQTRMRNLTRGIPWRDVMAIARQARPRSQKSYGFTHTVLYGQEQRLALTQEEATIVEQAYKTYTWNATLDSAVQRLDAGETLDFGAFQITKDRLYVHGLFCTVSENDTYHIEKESDVTLAWETISNMSIEDATWLDEEDISGITILIQLQPGNDPQLLLVPVDYVSNAGVLLALSDLFVESEPG